jgi:hypothetical protein
MDKSKINFPLRIRVPIKWGEEGLRLWKAGITPNAKPPSYKYIWVEEHQFERYMAMEPKAMKAAINKQKKAS